MAGPLPLSALLSHLYVAISIEVDNEFEDSINCRTTSFGVKGHGPWLTSVAMWFNCMKFVTEAGVTEAELKRLARTFTNLRGMVRWGYVRSNGESITPSKGGLKARDAWQRVIPAVEERWALRFGADRIRELRESLLGLLSKNAGLPDCMPIIHYGLTTPKPPPSLEPDDLTETPLIALIAKALLAYTLDVESRSELSVPIWANVLRLVPPEGIPRKSLPLLSGVSKEAIAVATNFLETKGYGECGTEGRTLIFKLSDKGRDARQRYPEVMAAVEADWRERFGDAAVDRLYQSLGELVSDRERLLDCIKPKPDGWRSKIPARENFPWQPMVTHRGGFPDGS